MTLFSIGFSTFAFIICLLALISNAMQGNTGWVVVMAICMVINALMIALNLSTL
jgi:hypothetical protein